MFSSTFLSAARVCAVVFGIACFANPCEATIMFTQSAVSTDLNFSPYTKLTDTTGFGSVGGTRMLEFTTDTNLTISSMGVGSIQAETTKFTTATFSPSTGFLFGILEINPQIAPAGTPGTFTLSAMDQFGTIYNSGSFTLGAGSNRVAAVGSGGMFIKSLSITANDALINGITQVRATATELAAVPEPSSGILLLSLAGIYGIRRRRKRQQSAA